MMKSAAKPLIALLIGLGVIVVGLAAFVWSGVYGIGADDPHIKPVLALMTKLRERSIEVRSGDITVPELRDSQMIASGAKNYAEMCMGCHLAPGMAKSELRAGLYPQPPNLSEPAARDLRQVFWVIKHGIKMTAMPAWGGSHDDKAIWALVAFISNMPTMPVAQYEQLASAGSPGHGMADDMQPGAMQAKDGALTEGSQAGAMKGMPMPAAKQPGAMPGKEGAAMPGMAAGSMKGMPMPAAKQPGSMPGMKGGAMPGMAAGSMQGMPMPAAKQPGAMPGMKGGAMPGMAAGSMQGMPMPAAKQPGAMPGMKGEAMPGMPADAMQGMPMPAGKQGAMPGMDGGAMPGMPADSMKDMPMPAARQGAMPAMEMKGMQGGKAPPDARDPDAYANGLTHGPMPGMDMADSASFGMLRLDKLEAVDAKAGRTLRIDGQAWYGGDSNKLWLKADGERTGGRLAATRTEALWNRTIATHWSGQFGVRRDFGDGPGRYWTALGVQGLAPYWFDVEATAYLGQSGRTAARVSVQYDLLFTQRLILQPNLEINAYGKTDVARGIGSGVSDVEAGLRLRYEIRRQFAPYLGVEWKRKLGKTGELARSAGESVRDTSAVAGVRFWF